MNSAFRGTVQLIAIGDEVGFELPPEIIDRYQLRVGDEIGVDWKNGDLVLTFNSHDAAQDPDQAVESP